MFRAVLAAAVSLAIAGPVAAEPVLYRNATLIDGTGTPGRPGMSVLVDGERIKDVQPNDRLPAPAGAQSLPTITGTVLRQAAGRVHIPAHSWPTDPLTARELEVLALLPTRLTNKELAARYFVSVNTIKSHMSHIYRKLDVTTRNEAIKRADELGLLQ